MLTLQSLHNYNYARNLLQMLPLPAMLMTYIIANIGSLRRTIFRSDGGITEMQRYYYGATSHKQIFKYKYIHQFNNLLMFLFPKNILKPTFQQNIRQKARKRYVHVRLPF